MYLPEFLPADKAGHCKLHTQMMTCNGNVFQKHVFQQQTLGDPVS